MPTTNLWPQILERVRAKINPQSFEVWLRPTRGRPNGDGTLHVQTPNQEFLDWIKDKWGKELEAAAVELGTSLIFDPPPEPAKPTSRKKTPVSKLDRGCPTIPAGAWYRWPKLYRDAVAHCSESSDNYHYVGFLVAAGAVLGKLVYTAMKDKLYPNLFVATVGRSGRGKGGATSEVFRLIQETSPVVTSMYSVDSAEGLISFIDRRVGSDERKQQSTVVIKLEELRRLIEKSAMKGLGSIIPVLCQAYDCPDVLETNTKTTFMQVRPPALTIFSSTTTKALEALEEKDVEGGIGNRFMWIPGVRKSEPVSTPPPPVPALWLEITRRLKEAVGYWAERQSKDKRPSEISVSPGTEAWRLYDSYYNRLFRRDHLDPLLETLSDRFRLHLRKTALILSAIDMVEETTAEIMQASIDFTEFLYAGLEFNFRGYSQSNYARDEQKLIDAVANRPEQWVYRRALQRSFRWDAEYFQRRLKAVAGFPNDPVWDGQLRQFDSTRGGRIIVSVNNLEVEEGEEGKGET